MAYHRYGIRIVHDDNKALGCFGINFPCKVWLSIFRIGINIFHYRSVLKGIGSDGKSIGHNTYYTNIDRNLNKSYYTHCNGNTTQIAQVREINIQTAIGCELY